jgi:hypothetical protein
MKGTLLEIAAEKIQSGDFLCPRYDRSAVIKPMWVDEVRRGYGLLGKGAWVLLIGDSGEKRVKVPAEVMVQVVRR